MTEELARDTEAHDFEAGFRRQWVRAAPGRDAAHLVGTAVGGGEAFVDNPVLGGRALNERGLHTDRVTLAHRAADFRPHLATCVDLAALAAQVTAR